MGNFGSKSETSEKDLKEYLSTMTLIRKEHAESIEMDIDIYRPHLSEFEEDLILLIEQTFDENQTNDSDQNLFKVMRSKIQVRKGFNCANISELLFVNYRVLSGLCMEKQLCTVALEYSEETLSQFILSSRATFSSARNINIQSAQSTIHFILNILEGLLCLKRFHLIHGFIEPNNIFVYNKSNVKPLFKLFDVSFLSRHKK